MVRLLAIALALLVWATSVRADEPPDPVLAEAKELYDEGIRLYADGRHAEAAVRFARAYELSRAPGLLWNLAQAQRLAGDCAGAAQNYRGYLRAEPGADNSGDARAHLAEMNKCADERAALDPTPEPDEPAGPDAPGAIDARDAPRPTERDDRGRTQRLVGLSLGVVGVGLAVGGVVFGIRAADASDELETRYATPGDWDADAAALEAAGERDEVLGIVFLGVGAAAIATGVTLYVLGIPEDEPHVGVGPVAGGAALTLSGRF